MNRKLNLSLLSQLMVLTAGIGWAGVSFGSKLPFLTIGTGNTTGVYYSAGHAVAKVYNPSAAEHGFRLDAEASNGSVDNINKVLDGTWAFGIAQADMLFKAQEGLGPWQGTPHKNLRAVAGLYTEAVLFVTRADDNIRSLADLRGKTLNIEAPGSSDHENALTILKAVGLDPQKDLTITEEKTVDASELLKNGDIDAYIYTVGHPNMAIRQDVVSGRKIRLVPVDPPLVEEFTRKRSFLTKTRVNTAYYPGLDNQGDIYTLGVKAILFTKADTPDATVSAVVSELIDNFDRFQRQHPAFAEVELNELGRDTVVPLHPGAEAVYRQHGHMLGKVSPGRHQTISDPQQSCGYEDGTWKGPEPLLLVAADFQRWAQYREEVR
jgi:TRAP transporter TAXI family solute receptor